MLFPRETAGVLAMYTAAKRRTRLRCDARDRAAIDADFRIVQGGAL